MYGGNHYPDILSDLYLNMKRTRKLLLILVILIIYVLGLWMITSPRSYRPVEGTPPRLIRLQGPISVRKVLPAKVESNFPRALRWSATQADVLFPSCDVMFGRGDLPPPHYVEPATPHMGQLLQPTIPSEAGVVAGLDDMSLTVDSMEARMRHMRYNEGVCKQWADGSPSRLPYDYGPGYDHL